MNIRNGRAGGAGSSGFAAAAATREGPGGGADLVLLNVAIANATPNAVIATAATSLQSFEGSFTDLSCHRSVQHHTAKPWRSAFEQETKGSRDIFIKKNLLAF
jgi:hypothetical protein